MKAFRKLFLLTSLLLVVGLACSLGSGGSTPAPQQEPPVQVQPTAEPVQQPTDEPAPAPTDPPAPTAEPAPTSAPVVVSKFFREEFDPGVDLGNWEYFTLGSGSDTDLKIEQEGDHLMFDLGDEDLYVYYMYTYETYDNVTITLNAENRGRNNNNVSLVCRMNDEGTQWYEFSVESGGLWYLYGVDDSYNIIDNGGTNALKQGKEVNEYKMICDGDQISLFVNGSRVKVVTDTRYGFNEGYAGFNISSLNVLPITVEVNWFELSEP